LDLEVKTVNPSHSYGAGKYKLHYLQKLLERGSLVNGYVWNLFLNSRMVTCITNNFQITNTTDTSLSCGAESYYWEIVNYFEGFCGKGFQMDFTDGTGPSSKNPVFK
jgi:hypothetical protein